MSRPIEGLDSSRAGAMALADRFATRWIGARGSDCQDPFRVTKLIRGIQSIRGISELGVALCALRSNVSAVHVNTSTRQHIDKSAIGNRQSAIGNRQSAIGNRQSANQQISKSSDQQVGKLESWQVRMPSRAAACGLRTTFTLR